MPPPIIPNRALTARNKCISRVRILPSKRESCRVLYQVKFLARVKEPLPLSPVSTSPPPRGAAAAEVRPSACSSRRRGSIAPETAGGKTALRMEGEKGGGGGKGRREGELERQLGEDR